MIKNLINDIQYVLKDVKCNELTDKQRNLLHKNFNAYIDFDYGETYEGDIVINVNKRDFNRMEYYYGLEYEREDIILKIEFDYRVVVVYCCENERLKRLMNYIEKV